MVGCDRVGDLVTPAFEVMCDIFILYWQVIMIWYNFQIDQKLLINDEMMLPGNCFVS